MRGMPERNYTVEQAAALIPELRHVLQRLQQAHSALTDNESLQHLATATAGNGGGDVGRRMIDASREVAEVATRLNDLGIELRDASSGLVDFPSERDGQPIYLCWNLSEDHIGHWHSRDTGFSDRQLL